MDSLDDLFAIRLSPPPYHSPIFDGSPTPRKDNSPGLSHLFAESPLKQNIFSIGGTPKKNEKRPTSANIENEGTSSSNKEGVRGSRSCFGPFPPNLSFQVSKEALQQEAYYSEQRKIPRRQLQFPPSAAEKEPAMTALDRGLLSPLAGNGPLSMPDISGFDDIHDDYIIGQRPQTEIEIGVSEAMEMSKLEAVQVSIKHKGKGEAENDGPGFPPSPTAATMSLRGEKEKMIETTLIEEKKDDELFPFLNIERESPQPPTPDTVRFDISGRMTEDTPVCPKRVKKMDGDAVASMRPLDFDELEEQLEKTSNDLGEGQHGSSICDGECENQKEWNQDYSSDEEIEESTLLPSDEVDEADIDANKTVDDGDGSSTKEEAPPRILSVKRPKRKRSAPTTGVHKHQKCDEQRPERTSVHSRRKRGADRAGEEGVSLSRQMRELISRMQHEVVEKTMDDTTSSRCSSPRETALETRASKTPINRCPFSVPSPDEKSSPHAFTTPFSSSSLSSSPASLPLNSTEDVSSGADEDSSLLLNHDIPHFEKGLSPRISKKRQQSPSSPISSDMLSEAHSASKRQRRKLTESEILIRENEATEKRRKRREERKLHRLSEKEEKRRFRRIQREREKREEQEGDLTIAVRRKRRCVAGNDGNKGGGERVVSVSRLFREVVASCRHAPL